MRDRKQAPKSLPMPLSTIVVPTYNERYNLLDLAQSVSALGESVRLIIVDDASPDGTGELADALAREFPHISVINRAGKLGLGTAYVEGFRRALADGADYVFSMDGDLSHDPAFIPQFWNALEAHDVVVGSRYLRGISVVNWPLRRLILSQFANVYASRMLGLRIKDCTSGYVGYRREVLEAIHLESISSEGYAFLIELKARCQRCGYRLSEVPIIFIDRRAGSSKLSKTVMLEAFWLPWRMMLERR